MKNILLYILLAYGISWIIWLPLYAPSLNLPVLPFHHALGGFGPAIAALFVGRRKVLNRLVRLNAWGITLVALFSPFLIGMIAYFGNSIFGSAPIYPHFTRSNEFPSFGIAELLLYNILFFGFGEEVGWRGFLLPKLQSYFNALNSSVLVTLAWALWHWPLFLYRPGYMEMGIGGITGWVFSLLTGSVLLTSMFNSSKGGLLACIIFHATIDIVFTSPAGVALSGWIGAMVTIWGIAVVIYFKPKNLASLNKTADV